MTPQKISIGQITVVFAIIAAATSAATQWAAHMLGYQTALGPAWFSVGTTPVYDPWRLYDWWYAFEAYAPNVFSAAGTLAAAGGVLGLIAAVIGSLWRARQAGSVTTYGSSRWAISRDIDRAGLFEPTGIFLGRFKDRYLQHDGPEHVMPAPTRHGKGLAGGPYASLLDRLCSCPRRQGREMAAHGRMAVQVLPLHLFQSRRPEERPVQPAARSPARPQRGAGHQ